MSTVWFTSDLHLQHARVAVHRAERAMICIDSQDPEGHCVRWHDRTLALHWDAAVKPNDQVWVLGDLSVGGAEATAYALNWIHDRPGEKHLVPGNHCPVHPMHRDSHRWMSAYMQVFASVQPFARRRVAGREVLLSHFPYEGDHTDEQRFTQYRLRDEGLWLMHGHTHRRERLSASTPIYRLQPGQLIPPNQIHVGVDAWGLKPVSTDSIDYLLCQVERGQLWRQPPAGYLAGVVDALGLSPGQLDEITAEPFLDPLAEPTREAE